MPQFRWHFEQDKNKFVSQFILGCVYAEKSANYSIKETTLKLTDVFEKSRNGTCDSALSDSTNLEAEEFLLHKISSEEFYASPKIRLDGAVEQWFRFRRER